MSATSTTTNSVPLSERAALTVRDAGSYLGLSRSKLYELIGEGKLASRKIGARRLVLRESLDKLLADANA